MPTAAEREQEPLAGISVSAADLGLAPCSAAEFCCLETHQFLINAPVTLLATQYIVFSELTVNLQ